MVKVKEYVFARTSGEMLVHYLQCGQKLEKHLIIKRKVSKTISQRNQFISGDVYIYQVDYHKRVAQK